MAIDYSYHGNCPGPASSPPIIRELIEIPQCLWLMRWALCAGIDATVGNTMAVEPMSFECENIKFGSMSSLAPLILEISDGLIPSTLMRSGWKLRTGAVFWKRGGILKSCEKLGGQFRNVRGSSNSKKKCFFFVCFGPTYFVCLFGRQWSFVGCTSPLLLTSHIHGFSVVTSRWNPGDIISDGQHTSGSMPA